jgi:hypothetical protein
VAELSNVWDETCALIKNIDPNEKIYYMDADRDSAEVILSFNLFFLLYFYRNFVNVKLIKFRMIVILLNYLYILDLVLNDAGRKNIF